MIRRDYILRMIAEFVEVLSRIRSLKTSQLWGKRKRPWKNNVAGSWALARTKSAG